MKRLCIHHNKDMDGYFSGAVVKKKYPEIELFGWDYKDPVPDIKDLGENYDQIIMIDITFPIDKLQELGLRTSLIIFDHHISFFKQTVGRDLSFDFNYSDTLSACELAYKHYFGKVPNIVEAVGKYDTWRASKDKNWETEILPIKFALYGEINKAEDVPPSYLEENPHLYEGLITKGKTIKKYVETMDEVTTVNYGFFSNNWLGEYPTLFINVPYFHSDLTKSHPYYAHADVLVGFNYNGMGFGVSLRSNSPDVDVSKIAQRFGGGGHKGAAGFGLSSLNLITTPYKELTNFEGDWFWIPKGLIEKFEEFNNYSDPDEFLDDDYENLFGQYRTGGDRNVVPEFYQ